MLMIVSASVFVMSAQAHPDLIYGRNVGLRADIVGELARTNDAGTGCFAPNAGKFIPTAWSDFGLDVA
jgi:hypothetical protein